MKRLLALFASLCVLCGKSFSADAPPIRVLVWDEQQAAQKSAYDGGFLGDTIAAYLAKQPGLKVTSVNFAMPNQGLSDAELDAAQVIVWWGHQKHGLVESARVEAVVQRVLDGRLALVALHSAHWARPFVRLMQERAKADALAQIPAAERATAKFEYFNDNPLGKVPRRDAPLTPASDTVPPLTVRPLLPTESVKYCRPPKASVPSPAFPPRASPAPQTPTSSRTSMSSRTSSSTTSTRSIGGSTRSTSGHRSPTWPCAPM